MKKHGKSSQRSEPTMKRTKARGPVQRDAKEVLAEVLEKLTGKLDAPAVSTSAKENRGGLSRGPCRVAEVGSLASDLGNSAGHRPPRRLQRFRRRRGK